MSNAAALYQLECMSSAARQGFSRAMNFVRRNASQKEFFSDGLKVAVAAVSANVDVVALGAVKMYFLDVSSQSGANATAWVQLFNVAAASVTLGTTKPDFTFAVLAGKSVTIPIADGEDSFFPTALSWAVTTTNGGATAVGTVNIPAVTLLYK